MSAVRAFVVVIALLVAGCTDPTHDAIRDACLKDALQEGASSAIQCGCFADLAKKYLKPEDYQLFGTVAEIYMSNDDDDVKAYRTVNALTDAGVGRLRATRLTFDFAFLISRVQKECSATQ